MTITSKFACSCKKCRKPIAQGEQIEWTKEGGAEHLKCPAVSPSRQAPLSPGQPPYHGKFRLVKQLHDESSARVGHAELDAEHAAVSGRPAPRPAADPLSRITAYLDKLPPLDGLRIAASLIASQQRRVDGLYRRKAEGRTA